MNRIVKNGIIAILSIQYTFFCSLLCCTNETIFIILGAPGVGKGSLTELCIKHLAFQELSTGKLCRQEIASGSEKGKLIQQYSMSTGMTPDEIIIEMVAAWLDTHHEDRPIIFDGYPRTKRQAELLMQLLNEKFPMYTVRVFLLYVCDQKELFRRIFNRLICENKMCQMVYNRMFLKDQNNIRCQVCGCCLIARPDDQEHIIRERLKSFNYHNSEIISFFESVGIHVGVIDTSTVLPQEVFEIFKKMLI